MYKDKDKQREAQQEWVRRKRADNEMEPGDKYCYHHVGQNVDFLVVLLSTDRIPGWNETVWRCAQYMIGVNNLHGAQIVLYTMSELRAMDCGGHLSGYSDWRAERGR